MKKILVLVSVSLLGGCGTMTEQQRMAYANALLGVTGAMGNYYGQQAQMYHERSLVGLQAQGNYGYRTPVINVYGAKQVEGYQPQGQKLCTSGWC